MANGYCQHGCYPVDKRWHEGDFRIEEDEIANLTGGQASTPKELQEAVGEGSYSGSGAFVIEDIFDFRAFVTAFGATTAEEKLMREQQPADEPYVLGHSGAGEEQRPVWEKKKLRKISISDIGQGPGIGAHLTVLDKVSTFYRYNEPFVVKDWMRASPQSQVHQEMVQRRQQAEQQINRVLSNLSDLYEQKQLLEHDLRRLEERKAHFEAGEDEKGAGGGYEDELKADFVDLVDQHTGRHSILQMQANNIFPSITADFYQMSGLEDLKDGALKDLPENEKAVLRKKWKLYEQWKEQFRTAVQSRYRDVERQLNSVQTSIEQTQKWLQPYVEDMERIQTEGEFEEQLGAGQELQIFAPHGYSNMYRLMKSIAWMDRSPGQKQDKYYDVAMFEPLHIIGAGLEQPQAPGQGLTIFSMKFWEFFMCKHVYDEIIEPQKMARINQVQRYISRYIGESGYLDSQKDAVKGKYEGALTEEEEEAIADAESEGELQEIELGIIDRMRPSLTRRAGDRVKNFFGVTDEFYHEDPEELRRELLGPYFPTQFYLDYKYDNDLYVMK